MDGVVPALADAEHAADAAGGADLLDLGAFVLVRALDDDLFAVGDQLDQAAGAGLGAEAAAHAFAPIHDGDAVDDADRLLRADLCAGAEAQAAVVAVGEADAVQGSGPAVLDADVVALGAGVFAAALAADEGRFAFHGAGVGAHDGCDLLSHGSAADGTAVDRSLLRGDGGRHGVAAGIAAGAAVVAGQDRADGSLCLVDLNVEFLAGVNQAVADDDADDGDDGCGDQNDGRIHIAALLRTTGPRSP